MRCLSQSPLADWPDFVGRACLRMPLREPTPRSDGRSCSLLPTSAICPLSVWCSCESQGTPQVNCSVTDIILDGKGRKVQRILVLLCCTLTSAYDYSLLENFLSNTNICTRVTTWINSLIFQMQFCLCVFHTFLIKTKMLVLLPIGWSPSLVEGVPWIILKALGVGHCADCS